MKFLIRTALLFTIILAGLASTVLAQTKTVGSETRWHSDRVSVAYMDQRITDAAEKYKEYAPIPRSAFFDIGYPRDRAEFEELDGYGLLLISALSHNETELPVKRAYVELDGKQFELKLLLEIYSKQSSPQSRISQTFGEYRVDSIYLFPVYFRKKTANVLVDFAQNRDGLQVTNFTDNLPARIVALPDTKPSTEGGLTDAVKRFMRREYPGFLDN